MLLDKSYEQIEPSLLPLLARSSILCSDGNQRYIKVAEAGTGIIHKRLIVSDHHRVEDEVFHIQTLNNYVSRWRKSQTHPDHGYMEGSSDSPIRDPTFRT